MNSLKKIPNKGGVKTPKKFPSKKAALALLVLFSFSIRLFALGSIPPGLYCDEASNGYNSYSILLTGRDEHGTFMPLYFKAFGEYKNPVFIYSAVPFIAALGLNVFSIRMVSAFYGALTVLALFFLCRKMFGEKTAFIASALLAISPWHLVFSRIAFEAITMPFFIVAGLYFLLRAKEHFGFALLSAACFSLAVYSYGIAYIFVPVFLAGFFAVYLRAAKKSRKEHALFLIAFLLLASPLVSEYLTESEHIQAIRSRGMASSIFSEAFALEYAEKHSVSPETVSLALYPANYLSYYSPEFLFLQGDENLRHSLPGKGVLFWFMLPLVLLGAFVCVRERKKPHFFLLFWLLVFPVAAASSIQQPHALRSITAIPAFEIAAALGAVFLYGKMRKANKPALGNPFFHLLLLIAALAFLEFALFELQYFSQYPEQSWPWFQHGYREAFEFTESAKDSYNRVYFYPGLSQWYDQPYILLAFFTKLEPAEFQEHGIADTKYSFLDSVPSTLEPNSLVVSRPGKAKGKLVKTIPSPHGNPVMEIREA